MEPAGRQEKGCGSMSKVEELIAATRLNDLVNKKEEDKQCKTVLWALAIVGAVAAIAAIAYAVYCFFRSEERRVGKECRG